MTTQNAINLNDTGIATYDGAGTFAGRTLQPPTAGLTISNANGVTGDPTLALSDDLAAIEGLGGFGVVSRTAANTWATSSITDNAIIVGDGGQLIQNIGPANNGTFISGATGIPSWLANGTTGQVLTATTGSPPSWGTAPITQVTGQLFTSSGAFTYTPTTGMKYVIVELVGGGGGGGAISAPGGGQGAAGGGGAGGAYARFILTAAQVGASLAGSVGVGGTGGAAGANNGTTGGNTTLATTAAWTVGGGTGGQGVTAGATSIANAVSGGTVTTGTGTILATRTGGTGGPAVSNATFSISGQAGDSQYGMGYPPIPIVTAQSLQGVSGVGYGAGGGGASGLGVSDAEEGGDGITGVAIFTEFL